MKHNQKGSTMLVTMVLMALFGIMLAGFHMAVISITARIDDTYSEKQTYLYARSAVTAVTEDIMEKSADYTTALEAYQTLVDASEEELDLEAPEKDPLLAAMDKLSLNGTPLQLTDITFPEKLVDTYDLNMTLERVQAGETEAYKLSATATIEEISDTVSILLNMSGKEVILEQTITTTIPGTTTPPPTTVSANNIVSVPQGDDVIFGREFSGSDDEFDEFFDEENLNYYFLQDVTMDECDMEDAKIIATKGDMSLQKTDLECDVVYAQGNISMEKMDMDEGTWVISEESITMSGAKDHTTTFKDYIVCDTLYLTFTGSKEHCIKFDEADVYAKEIVISFPSGNLKDWLEVDKTKFYTDKVTIAGKTAEEAKTILANCLDDNDSAVEGWKEPNRVPTVSFPAVTTGWEQNTVANETVEANKTINANQVTPKPYYITVTSGTTLTMNDWNTENIHIFLEDGATLEIKDEMPTAGGIHSNPGSEVDIYVNGEKLKGFLPGTAAVSPSPSPASGGFSGIYTDTPIDFQWKKAFFPYITSGATIAYKQNVAYDLHDNIQGGEEQPKIMNNGNMTLNFVNLVSISNVDFYIDGDLTLGCSSHSIVLNHCNFYVTGKVECIVNSGAGSVTLNQCNVQSNGWKITGLQETEINNGSTIIKDATLTAADLHIPERPKPSWVSAAQGAIENIYTYGDDPMVPGQVYRLANTFGQNNDTPLTDAAFPATGTPVTVIVGSGTIVNVEAACGENVQFLVEPGGVMYIKNAGFHGVVYSAPVVGTPQDSVIIYELAQFGGTFIVPKLTIQNGNSCSYGGQAPVAGGGSTGDTTITETKTETVTYNLYEDYLYIRG